ncbi:GNAT family N-acetyltransferase [Nonomuraea sp. NPDC048916]|uniref:GNAT family N-acetyltransferase n=1 Tax=Nonomuraea sp. NPDC048916 TaxID=3154232 RepID=UPI0033C63D87
MSPRVATGDDLAGIVEVFLACWTGSYASVLPERLVSAMSPDRARELWTAALASGRVVVADEGGRVLGVTRFGGDTVHSLYVHPHAQGGGLGMRLLGAAESALSADGVSRAFLWVFRDNLPSIGFYRRQGWTPDGTSRVTPEFGEPELRLTKELV